MNFDLAVIGNDEAGIELGLAAALAQQKVITILPESRHSSWMFCQGLRRLTSTLLADRSLGRRFLCHRRGTPGMIRRLLRGAVAAETAELVQVLRHAGVTVVIGEARFSSPGRLKVSVGMDCSRQSISAGSAIIATGIRYSSPHRTLGLLPRNTPESLLELSALPRRIRFLGGDDFAAGLGSVLSLFGADVTVELQQPLDSALEELAQSSGVHFVGSRSTDGTGLNGSDLSWAQDNTIIDCRQSLGFTDHLNLHAIGVEPDEHGQLWCSTSFETWCDSVFGIGSVVGFARNKELSPTQQAERVINRIQHRLRPPYFSRAKLRLADVSRV